MNFLLRRDVKLAIAIAGSSVLLYGLYQLWKMVGAHQRKKDEETQSNPAKDEGTEDEEEHVPYDVNIEDKHQDKMGSGRMTHIKALKDINYRIIFSLMKGSTYQGIAIISFQLDTLSSQEDFRINYNGTAVKYLMVNSVRIDPRDVVYLDHFIKVPKEVLREGGKNTVQVIFENSYSFLNEGLSAYFMVDENGKYSLRQQVIYASNGCLQVQKIIPCINCLNQCKVQVETIHPNNFEVFSNASKSLQRFCSLTEYEKYPFLFQFSSNSINKSIKLNSSTLSSASGADSGSSQYSSSNFNNRKKANTHFYSVKLHSIHHLFLFSSVVVELMPTPSKHRLEEAIMLRYFCKPSESHRLSRFVNKLHGYILETMKRISPEDDESFGHKLDVIIISDTFSEGYFAPGVILLSQASLADGLGIRSLYLIVRALFGIKLLTKGQNTVTLDQLLTLNELVFAKFEQFRNYLFLKNQKYQKIRDILFANDKQEYLKDHQAQVLKYYAKELKFIVRTDLTGSISFQFGILMQSFRPDTLQQFWENFLSNYNFLSPLIIEPLLKIALHKYGAPKEDRLREQLKVCFSSSKHVLGFYTNQEISDNLPKFFEHEVCGLEERLPHLKVKQKFKDFITQKYEKYLPVKSNLDEAEAVYLQFKKFNEAKNFHHYLLLKSQIKRVLCFDNGFIKPERIALPCSISGWKLLKRLSIYPSDQAYFKFLRTFDDIQTF